LFVQHDPTLLVAQTVKVDMSSVVGIEELQGKQISIYPNPAQDYILLNSSGKGVMQIFDMTGKIVYTSNITNTTQLVDVRNFVKGVYIVNVTSEANTFTKKIVIE